ncbi:MAG: FG-GAP repeat protein, partial [Giesbergeria sp.]
MALSADGSTLVAGAPVESSSASGINGNQADNAAEFAGAVYAFSRSGSTWAQQAYLKASNTETGDQYGHSLSLSADGQTLAVGAIAEDGGAKGIDGDQTSNSALYAGAVYLYNREGSGWTQSAYVKASDTSSHSTVMGPGSFASFGYGLALSADGRSLAVGAPGESSKATGIGGEQMGPYAGG